MDRYSELPVPDAEILSHEQALADDTVDVDEIDLADYWQAEERRCKMARPLDDGGPDHLDEDGSG
jgi:hypothetical protein